MPKPLPPPNPNNNPEVTHLSPIEELHYQQWLKASGIHDADEPDSYYDYRGLFKDTNGLIVPQSAGRHFVDTYKQHGHPTFSHESKYSLGPFDGGQWMPTTMTPPIPQAPDGMAISHPVDDHLTQPIAPMPSHGATPTAGDMTPENLQQQLLQRYLDTKDAHHKSLDKHAGFLEKVLKPIMIPEKPPLAMDGPGTGGFSGRGTDFQMPPAPGQGLPDLGNPPSAAMPPGMDDLVNRDPSTFNGPQSIPPMPLHDPSKPNMLDDLVQRGTPPQPQINDLVNRIPPDQNQIISQAILKMMQGQGR